MTKKYIAFSIFIIVLLVISYKAFYTKQGEVLDLRTFNGELVSFEGNTVTLRGMFVSSSTLPADLQGQQELVFRVDGSTQYKKLAITMPSYESLRASGKTSGSYKINDLPRTEGAGSAEDLKGFVGQNGIYAQVDFPYSVYSKKNPVASFIFYQALIKPVENI